MEALWIEMVVNCTVTFDPNGGSWSGSPSVTCPRGSSITLSTDVPTRDSYTFLNWSCEGETYSAGASLTVSSDMTLKAEWVPDGSSEPMVPIIPDGSSEPMVPIIPDDGQDVIEVVASDDEDGSWIGRNGKAVILTAIIVAIIAELAVLIISKR